MSGSDARWRKQKCGGAPHIVGPANRPRRPPAPASKRYPLLPQESNGRVEPLPGQFTPFWTVTEIWEVPTFFAASSASTRMTWEEPLVSPEVFQLTWYGAE